MRWALWICGTSTQSARPGVSPWQKRPVAALPASCRSTVSSPVSTQCRYQRFLSSSDTPMSLTRKRRTRRLSSGWISQAMSRAMARTRARPSASAGRSGGSGWVSSRYSMIASDWVSGAIPGSSSTSAGTSCDGDKRAKGLAELLVLHQVHGDVLVAQPLERQRDPHPVRGRGAEVVVELHPAGARFSGRRSAPAGCRRRRRSPSARRRARPRPRLRACR